jgi:hypothetical protein
MARWRTALARGHGVLAGGGGGLWCFIGEGLRLGARGDRGGGDRGQQHVRRRGSASRCGQGPACAHIGTWRAAARIPMVLRRACPSWEARSPGRRGAAFR